MKKIRQEIFVGFFSSFMMKTWHSSQHPSSNSSHLPCVRAAVCEYQITRPSVLTLVSPVENVLSKLSSNAPLHRYSLTSLHRLRRTGVHLRSSFILCGGDASFTHWVVIGQGFLLHHYPQCFFTSTIKSWRWLDFWGDEGVILWLLSDLKSIKITCCNQYINFCSFCFIFAFCNKKSFTASKLMPKPDIRTFYFHYGPIC